MELRPELREPEVPPELLTELCAAIEQIEDLHWRDEPTEAAIAAFNARTGSTLELYDFLSYHGSISTQDFARMATWPAWPKLSVFGVGADLREADWRAVIRQLLAQGLLAVEGDYGTLVLTEASGDVLGRRRQVMLRREPERPVSAAKAAKVAKQSAAEPADLPAEAATLFERLGAWRAATAKEQSVPAYVIFHDATLRQIAAEAPTTLAQLSTVSGVGENKLAKFGQQILDTVAAAD